MRARVDTIGGRCFAWLVVMFAVWCIGFLGPVGLWPLAFWIAGLSPVCVMTALLILCWFGVPCGMWDPDGMVKSPHDYLPSKSFMFHSQFCRPTIFGIRGLAQMRSPGWGCGWTWTCATSRRGAGRSPCRSMPSCGKWCWPFVLLFAACFRFGEALHPGPAGLAADTWSLGIANPSGLNGKLDQLNALPGDAWLLSETQLSSRGVATLHKGLKMLKSHWKYAIPGSPCRSRRGTDTGAHTGVMVLSKMPARALPHDFSDDVYSTARVQVVGLAVADVWVTLGVLYGLPCNAQHKQARYQTDALLSDLVDRVAFQTVGPRAIGGDFNFGPDELDQLDRLRSLGFREVQDLRAWQHGISAEATGRGSKRIDQLWISPELQRVYQSTSVEFDHWADHAAVSATFSHAGLSVKVSSWFVPTPFPWPTQWSCQLDVDFQGELTHEYAKFWSQLETQARCWNQHQGLHVTKRQCGRARVLDTSQSRQFLCPVKKARPGDVQPTYMGISLQHARYFRQLRRLQSLSRLLQKGVATWNAQVNRDETWRAIRTAVGFPGGFAAWWTTNGLLPVICVPLPLCCPVLDVIMALFNGFHDYMKKYEASLVSQRYQFAKNRRAKHLAHVFQDCKDEPLPQADTLIDRISVGIEEVRQEDNSLVLVRPVTLLEGLPVVVEGHAVQVVAHSEDQVWLDTLPPVNPGSVLSQERAVVSDADILDRFAAEWTKRWVKHDHVQPGQWDQICGFLERTVKPINWTYEPWTLDRISDAIRHKKPRAAKGPDGVSQPDLQALPTEARQHMLGFFEAVENGAKWPAQLAAGFVSSLAKHPGAQSVSEFRPVVVYSLPYRVWSTVRAREALQTVVHLLPDSVKGGVPSRQAKSIWFELAYTLERAYLDGFGVHGLLMDIQKWFNNIPRLPLWHALSLLGFPLPTLRAWVAFVSAQTRRFKVRQSVGAPIASNCGLPEGCALSVFGMVIVDWMLDWWLRAQEVRVDLRTFVDDWGVLFREASAFERVWTALEQFTNQLDLAIDMAKTRLWSTDAEARREFRQGHLVVTLAARNLGAHQNFSRHCHNAELQKRLAHMPRVWVRLKASPATYRQKLAAIHMMAWPRALHGISVVHLGESHWKVLRSGAVRALKADRKGANPYLHLASSQVQSDPEAWAILQTLRDVRELGDHEVVEPTLGLFSSNLDFLPANGPSAVLLSRLRRLGWEVGSQGLVQDRLGTFSILRVAWDELVVRVRLAWGHVLAAAVAHRPTFDGLQHVDLSELASALSFFGPSDLVYLRCHLDGTLFTENGRAHFRSDVSGKCPWCPAKDGFHHRAWQCPHFAACRSHLTPCQLAALSSLPACLVDHGWPVVLPEWEVVVGWYLRDDGLCRMSPVEPSVRSQPQLLELFVDGTGAYPGDVKLRFAAWAVTAAPGGIGSKDNQLLMGGHVVGLSQTPFRAELTAVLHASLWAVKHNRPIRIWCNCQGVSCTRLGSHLEWTLPKTQCTPLRLVGPSQYSFGGSFTLGENQKGGFSWGSLPFNQPIGRLGLLAQWIDRRGRRSSEFSQIR